MPKTYAHWSDRELLDLAAGVQKYGFTDPQKLASLIKTKSATSVKTYILFRMREFRKNAKKLEKETTGVKPQTSWNFKDVEGIKNWSTLCKWAKIIENQTNAHAAKMDYSRIVMKNLCQKFYDEAEEVTNPEVLDIKAIYRFMLQCVSGEVPSQLGIKESAYILVLFRCMEELFQNFDFKEENHFITSFRKRLEFFPASVKDEFKKGETGAVPIPSDLFKDLRMHRNVVNSFNPLGVPLWMLSKEQEFVKNLLSKNHGSVNSPSSSNSKDS